MKTKIAAALLAIAAMLNTACEQHKWSETSQLFKKGHGEAHGAHGGEAAGHADKGKEKH